MISPNLASRLFAFALLSFVCGLGSLRSSNSPPSSGPPKPSLTDDGSLSFENDIAPILEKRCARCHAKGAGSEGSFDLSTRSSFIHGGQRGVAVYLDSPESSPVLQAIRYQVPEIEMPPTGKLPPSEIETLEQWIREGASYGETGRLELHEEAESDDGPMSVEEGKNYWAYKKVERPRVPEVAGPYAEAGFDQHPIDAFIAQELSKRNLLPSEEADRRTFLIRASYNLIGLPPTPEEVKAFQNDPSPQAYERVVDRLLASPHYGEQWARHWMDTVRYAETDGYERDSKKSHMWRYRDYLIRAFNQDKPYDRFLHEQIAGDELVDGDSDSIIATGFSRLQIWDDEPVDRAQARADYIADIVDTASATFLGTTVGCARCHDHKKDPISQADYYRFFAFFNNITEPRRGNPRHITRDLADVATEELSSLEAARLARIDSLEQSLAQTESAFLDTWQFNDDKVDILLSDGREEGQNWRLSFEEQEGWHLQGFDDSKWTEQLSPFGQRSGADAAERTVWNSKKIFLRQRFRLTEIPKYLFLDTYYDDEIEVHINGILIYESRQHTGRYVRIQLPPEASKALVNGSNSLAIRGIQHGGYQYLDLGLGAGIVDREVIVEAAIEKDGERLLGRERVERYHQEKAELQDLIEHPYLDPYPASVVMERSKDPPAQFVHRRGNANVPGEEVVPGFPEVLGGGEARFERTEHTDSSGRRLSLAQWMTDPKNPLTARVMVNRIWQHHFGRGIVESSSDFGQLGIAPTHPELLDYLASEFMRGGWSIKAIQRLIMTSKTYRMGSRARGDGLENDPINKTFWRFPMKRLTAEQIRDAVLATNGTLTRELFGPSIYTRMPEEVLATASRPGDAWGTSTPTQQDRRSVYVFVKRSLREPFLESFDQAETDTPCPVRFTTTVPTQALISLNSDFMQEESLELARRLKREVGNDQEQQVQHATRLLFARSATQEEVDDHLAFLRDIQRDYSLDEEKALSLLCLVLYNLNEFYWID